MATPISQTPSTPQSRLESMIAIQEGCMTDEYMRGLYNGLVVAHYCLVTGSTYQLAEAPKKQNKVRYKK